VKKEKGRSLGWTKEIGERTFETTRLRRRTFPHRDLKVCAIQHLVQNFIAEARRKNEMRCDLGASLWTEFKEE